jgi:hypothetical protein
VELHIHAVKYLQSDFIRNVVQEFMSPRFRSETDFQFEAVLLLGAVCAGFAMSRRRYVEGLWVLYFAHSALSSARHIPLFLIVAAPVIARKLRGGGSRGVEVIARNSVPDILNSLSQDVAAGLRRTTFWVLVGVVPMLLLTTAKRGPLISALAFRATW